MDREFIDFIIEERIKILRKEAEIISEEEIKGELNDILKDYLQTEIEVQINQLINKIIFSERKLYLMGIREGIKLIKEIEKL